jgi:ATP-binding cassette, subfamily B, bacterial
VTTGIWDEGFQASEQNDRFEIIGETVHHPGPRAHISRDRSLSWWRRILPVMASHRLTFAGAIVFSFTSLIFQTLVPRFLMHAVDNFAQHARASFHGLVITIVIFGIIAGLSGYLSRRFLFTTAYNVEADLRNFMYEHLAWLSFSFYDRVQSGQLISRANSDIRSVQMYFTFAPQIIVQSFIGVVSFAFMLAINVPMSLVAMVTMPLLYIVGVKMRQKMFPISWIIQARLADVATVIDENINGVRVVKSFAQEEYEINRLADAATKVAWAYTKDADIRGQWSPWVQNLPQLGLALVLATGGFMVLHHHTPVGAIVAFNAYLLMLQAPFMMLGQLVMMGQRARASAERIFEILDERPQIIERNGAYDLERAGGGISFEHVRFGYADGPDILTDFTATIAPGETVALVGRTGSGKSTVARLLARFYDCRDGTIRIDGHDIRDLTLPSLRGSVGLVMDEPFLFSVSIRDNIAYGRSDATLDEIEAAAKAANAHEFIVKLPMGYDTVVGERGYTLSGGQRQRIAISRTLLVNPPILILDDATSAIDVHVETQIHDALERLLSHRTTLVIAHRISTIALASRVLLMENGEVVATGTHEELLATTPLYGEVLAQVTHEETA